MFHQQDDLGGGRVDANPLETDAWCHLPWLELWIVVVPHNFEKISRIDGFSAVEAFWNLVTISLVFDVVKKAFFTG